MDEMVFIKVERDPQFDNNKRKEEIDSFTKSTTTPLTRVCNRMPRIMADQFTFINNDENLFKESQERVINHLNDMISSQRDVYEDSIRKIDEISQENDEKIEKLEKSLIKLKKIISKRKKEKIVHSTSNVQLKLFEKGEKAIEIQKFN